MTKYRRLKIELGTLLYDNEFPEDIGIVVEKDEKRETYRLYCFFPGRLYHYKSAYIENECTELTIEGLPLYERRMRTMLRHIKEAKDYNGFK
jgi:hypothetical protein